MYRSKETRSLERANRSTERRPGGKLGAINSHHGGEKRHRTKASGWKVELIIDSSSSFFFTFSVHPLSIGLEMEGFHLEEDGRLSEFRLIKSVLFA